MTADFLQPTRCGVDARSMTCFLPCLLPQPIATLTAPVPMFQGPPPRFFWQWFQRPYSPPLLFCSLWLNTFLNRH